MKTTCSVIDRLSPSLATCLTATACLGMVLVLLAASASAADPSRSSWVFKRSTFTHAPESGARVAQYDRPAPVEELPDPRLVTSGYRRTRTNLRGAEGSVDSTYQVQSWANGRGGLDAEWERFHDAWRQSTLSGGFFQGGGPGFGGPGFGGSGFGGPGFGRPGFGGPGFGYGPAYGSPPTWYPQQQPHPQPHHGHHGHPQADPVADN